MAACAGDDPDSNIEVLIGQLVKILQGGEEVRLSKRAGTLVTLPSWSTLIGVDALRYSLARYPADSPLDPRRRADHPGEQRQPGLLRPVRPRAASRRCCATPPTSASTGRAGSSTRRCSAHEREGELLRALAEFPRVVAAARRSCASRTGSRATSRTRPATFHRFYDACRVLPHGRRGAERRCTAARLLLVAATRTVLANGLGLLGVSAPERM